VINRDDVASITDNKIARRVVFRTFRITRSRALVTAGKQFEYNIR